MPPKTVSVLVVCDFALCLTACSRQMDVAVVLDLSGSNDDIFDAIVDFTRVLTLGLPVSSGSVRIAVVRYSDSANVSFYLDEYSTNQQVTKSSTRVCLHRYKPTQRWSRVTGLRVTGSEIWVRVRSGHGSKP